jgi:hypothetical protein
MIFDSINDYKEFMVNKLTHKQLNYMENYLKYNITQLFENKVEICKNNHTQFNYFHQKILNSFKKIINESKKINQSNEKNTLEYRNNYLIYFSKIFNIIMILFLFFCFFIICCNFILKLK